MLAIIQARMGSSRLPGKVLADIEGRPMIQRVIERVREAGSVDLVIVATSNQRRDDAVADFCAQSETPVFRGSEADVLDRFYGAVKEFGHEETIRITADCPLIDPEVIDHVVGRFREQQVDYATNGHPHSYPVGLDVEVFRSDALVEAWQFAGHPSEREHVTPFIRTSGRFRTLHIAADEDYSDRNYRWTVDNADDLEFVRLIWGHFRDKERFGYRDIIQLLDRNPELLRFQGRSTNHSGYHRSLLEQAKVGTCGEPQLPQAVLWRKRLHAPPSDVWSADEVGGAGMRFPIVLERASGCRVWDIDGNEFLDYRAPEAVLLGHADQQVDEAYIAQLKLGNRLGECHALEAEFAERLVEWLPPGQHTRVLRHGVDAIRGAAATALRVTGRASIACVTNRARELESDLLGNEAIANSRSCPCRTQVFDDVLQLMTAIGQRGDEFAAVVIEPSEIDDPVEQKLNEIREGSQACGAMLILDEVDSGFRYGLGGIQYRTRVRADIACFGESLANGYEIACVCSTPSVLEEFEKCVPDNRRTSNPAAIAAALKTIEILQQTDALRRLRRNGLVLQEAFNSLVHEAGLSGRLACVGPEQSSRIKFLDRAEDVWIPWAILRQESWNRGMLIRSGHRLTTAHDPAALERTLQAHAGVVKTLAYWLSESDPTEYFAAARTRTTTRIA